MASSGNSGKIRKIGLISPVFPFRGGISQYSTQLIRALNKRCLVFPISFKRLYPSFIYPGQSQYEPFADNASEPGVSYCIDVLNFSTWIRAVRKLRVSGVNSVIIPWWSVIHFPWTVIITQLLTLSNIPVILICHNIGDHDRPKRKSILIWWILHSASGFIVNCNDCEMEIRKYNPDARILNILHPVFDQYPQPKGTLPRRAPLELLFFGFVRPYKGLDVLAQAMQILKGENIHLSIVGEWLYNDSGLRKQLESDDRIELVDRYVDNSLVGEFFSRADAIILPYHTATGSGIGALTYHYHKPVIISDIPSLKALVEQGILRGLLFESGNPEDLARAIVNIAHFPDIILSEDIQVPEMSWDHLAISILEFDITTIQGEKSENL
jgi:glycosyltransferase involved in cell wall biosynthesis